jgi:PAS domain S-box-containing protein
LKTSYRIGAWIFSAALLATLGASLSLWSFRQIEESSVARKQSYAAITSADDFMASVRDAETGQRGFALTGDALFLAPYQAVVNGIHDHLLRLRQLHLTDQSMLHLERLSPLVDAKLAEMAANIELRRKNDIAAVVASVRSGRGKRLMDEIRVEMGALIEAEGEALAQHEQAFNADMRRMFVLIISTSLFSLMLALAFAYLVYRQSQQRLKNMIHLETRHLLEIQENTNRQLRHAIVTLQASEEKLDVTLNSIGDAVIATDADARITRLNPVAEQLTGWTHAEALGQPVATIFRIVNQLTRQSAKIPVMDTLAHGTVQGLANHTMLIARDLSECAIADSCAPIRDRTGEVVGAVLVFRNVSEEYAAQQALRDSAAQIQTILSTVVDGIITVHADTGLIETMNPAAERMFGYAAAELIAQHLSVLIPELEREERNGSLDYYRASEKEQAIGIGREVTGRRQDGSHFPLEIAVSEMWLGGKRFFTGVLRDISARKQAEEALLKAGALQSAIFNSANFSSIATDARGVIQIFNVGAERMLGYTAAEVMNKITPADISDPLEVVIRAETLSRELGTPIAPGFEALVFKALRGIEDIYELTYIRKDGSRFPAVVSVTALRDAQEAIIGYLLIGTDNTARKKVEEERSLLDHALQEKNIELEKARQVADKANLAKSVFLSSMSHELRTPLSAILGFAQLIESGTPQPTPTQKRSIDQILKGGWYLLELINEILDLALIESGKQTLSLEPILLPELMDECESMIEPQARNRGIRMNFGGFETPCFVQADRTRLKQVLINLLSNAIKYNSEGGSVFVDCIATPPDSIRVSVRDTGAGLTPDQLTQLFQPFNRLGQEAIGGEGTGIGLVVSKRLVELMHGVIGVESVPGKGSMFWFELKLTSAPQCTDDVSSATARSAAPGQSSAPLRTLLYVEDNPANLMLVEDLIARRPDIHLLSARDGHRGIEIARAARPDLILMDINLPGISGIEAMKTLAADPATARIPVVAISANAIPLDIAKGLEAGFFRYLTKPIKVVEFMETLDIAFEYAQAEAARNTSKELS